MSQRYLMGSSNLNNQLNNLKIPNFNGSSRLPSDDLLSTHPLLTHEPEQSLKANVSTEIEEKIIIISSEDRDFTNESLFDFRISFNKSSSRFIKTPVYFNNKTVPQNIYEREKGIAGGLNTNGWVDITGREYPKYDPSLEPGEIVSFDSILDMTNSNISVNTDSNNMLSIKLIKAIIPNNLLTLDEVDVTYIPNIDYLRVNINPLDNNYSSSNNNINNSTDILVRHKTIDLGFTYFPINEYALSFDPPRNGLNQFNLSIRPNYYPDLMSEKQKITFDALFTNDVVSLLDIDFFDSVIRLSTTYFRMNYWKKGMIIKIKNLLPNLLKNENVNFTLLKSIETYFNENPLVILYTCLRLPDGNLPENSFLGNTVFLAAPHDPNKYYTELDNQNTKKYLKEIKTIFPESTLHEIKRNYLKYYTTVFSFNKFSEVLASIKTLKVNFKKQIENIPRENDTAVINLSLQCLYVFKIRYLKTKIDFNQKQLKDT